jgi:DNA-binding transcriptional ArsR family regulator
VLVALRTLAHPARIAILRLIAESEQSPSAVATLLNLSRPATSQHLKLLSAAGLVHVRAQSRHRLYTVDQRVLTELRALLDSLHGEAHPARQDDAPPAGGGPPA